MYEALQARIKHGRIVPLEPEKVPESGEAVVVILKGEPKKPDWEVIKSCIGHLELREDPAEWQKAIR